MRWGDHFRSRQKLFLKQFLIKTFKGPFIEGFQAVDVGKSLPGTKWESAQHIRSRKSMLEQLLRIVVQESLRLMMKAA